MLEGKIGDRRFSSCRLSGMGSIFLLLAYKIAMDGLYKYLNPLSYTYMRVDAYAGDIGRAWLAYGVILLLFRPVLRKPFPTWRFSEFVLFMLLILSVVPGLSMCSAGAFPERYVELFYIYWILFFFLASVFPPMKIRFANRASVARRDKEYIMFWLVVLVSLIILVLFLFFTGGNFFASSLVSLDVHDVRMAWRNVSVPLGLRYAYTNVPCMLAVLIMYFLQGRRWIGVWLLFMLYMLFSCAAHRSILFWGMVSVFAYAARNRLSVLGVLSLLLMVCAMVPFVLPVESFFFRVSFEANSLSCCYFDYFSSHMPVLSSLFAGTPVDRGNFPFVIGTLYRDSWENYCNNGLIGAGFMMAGVWGVLLSPLLWNIYFSILDGISRRLAWWIKFGASMGLAFTMTNVWMTTLMVSHGGIALLFMSWLCSKPDAGGRCTGLAGRRNDQIA